MKIIEEFKAFAIRGNVVDLAVAVIIGTAFGKMVSSLVDTVLMPVIGILLNGIDLSSIALEFGSLTIAYGKFIQAVVDFTIIAFVIFMTLRVVQRIEKRKTEEAPTAIPTEEVLLLREIRDLLKK